MLQEMRSSDVFQIRKPFAIVLSPCLSAIPVEDALFVKVEDAV